jgi:hypothetical protein
MRRRTCLNRLNESFARRIIRLEFAAAKIAGKTGNDIDQTVAYVAIEALSAWSGFSREFYLSCAFLYPKTIRGQHVNHRQANILGERDALLYSIRQLKGKASGRGRIAPRDEPTWHEKRALPSLSRSLALSNYNSVVTGFSYPTTFFDDLPVVRNFYAHRSKDTAEKVLNVASRKYGNRTIRHPNELINDILQGRVQTLLQEWLGDMRQIGAAICQ